MPPVAPPKKLKGLKLRNLQPAAVVNHRFVPVEDIAIPKSRSAKMATRRAALPTSLPGGRAMVATTKAFGVRSAPVEIAELDDGTTIATFELMEDGFEFGVMFKKFRPPNVDLFQLDNVKVVWKQKPNSRTSEVLLGGRLRMDSKLLTPFKKFLSLEEDIVLGSNFKLSRGENVSGKIEPREFSLHGAAPFHVELDEGRIAFSELQFFLDVTPGPKGRGWRIVPRLVGKLQIDNLTDGFSELECEITYEDGSLQVNASIEELAIAKLGNLRIKNLAVEFSIGKENKIDVAGDIKFGRKKLEVAGTVSREFSGLYAKLSSLTFKDISNLNKELTGFELGEPDFGVRMKNVTVGIATDDCKVNGHDLKKGFQVSGELSVHRHKLEATAVFEPGGVKFHAGMDDLLVGPVTINKPHLKMDIYSAKSEKATRFEINGKTKVENGAQNLTVDCSLVYQRNARSNKWEKIVYAGLDVNEFSLAKIIPGVSPGTIVDDIGFVRAAIIYASNAGEVTAANHTFKAEKGLQLLGEVKPIPQITQLLGDSAPDDGMELRAFFGAQSGIGISMPESTRLHLSDSVSCDPFEIKIVAVPKPELNLIFGVNVDVPNQEDDLDFDFQLSVSPIDASGSGTMDGYWSQPFGLSGLKIGPETALEVGIEYQVFSVSGVPSKFGLVGGLKMGKVVAAMAAGIATNPSEMILYGEVQKLTPDNLIAFTNEIAGTSIPANSVPDFFELNHLKLYAAPAGGTIGTLTFEPGFSFNADLVFFGKRANCFFRVGSDGLEARGEIEELELGPLKIGGKEGRNLVVDLAVTTERQGVMLDGEIEFLGSSIGIYADVSRSGLEFEFEQSFLGLLDFTVTGKSSGSLLKPKSLDFQLTAEFENRLTEYLRTTVSDKIQEAIDTVEQDIDAAKAEVSRTQAAYESEFNDAITKLNSAQAAADRHLDKLQADVRRERENYSKLINDARAEVARAKKVFDAAFRRAQEEVTKAQRNLDQSVRNAKSAIDRARRKYDSDMRRARAELDRAERSYYQTLNQAKAKINAAQRNVDSLNGQINSTKRIIRGIRWYESYKHLYYGPKLAGLWVAHKVATGALWLAREFVDKVMRGAGWLAFQTAKGTVDSVRRAGDLAMRGAQQGLEAARRAGNGVLEGAKLGLEAVRTGIEFTAFEAAKVALNAAETTGRFALTAAETALSTIGRSLVYLALEAAKGTVAAVRTGTSALAFESAKLVLEGAKLGTTAVLKLAQWIAEQAGNIIDIKRVKLSASLKDIQRGKFFDAEIDIVLFGHEFNWTISFDVTRIGDFIEDLFQKAFGEAKALIAIA